MRKMKEKDFTSKFRKELPYSVPQGYFDSLPERIQEKCASEHPIAKKQNVTLWDTLKAQVSLAAGFAALAILAFAGYYVLQPTNNDAVILSNDDYIEIIQRNIYDYDEGSIVDEVKPLETNDSLPRHDEEMIQYLLDQNIDYTTLIEQY